MNQKTRRKYEFFKELPQIKLKDGLIIEEYCEFSDKVRLHYAGLTYDYFPKAEKYHRHKDNKWFDLTIKKFMIAICDPCKNIPF
jgi:hypothetical protein